MLPQWGDGTKTGAVPAQPSLMVTWSCANRRALAKLAVMWLRQRGGVRCHQSAVCSYA